MEDLRHEIHHSYGVQCRGLSQRRLYLEPTSLLKEILERLIRARCDLLLQVLASNYNKLSDIVIK